MATYMMIAGVRAEAYGYVFERGVPVHIRDEDTVVLRKLKTHRSFKRVDDDAG